MTREKWIHALCGLFARECAEDFVGLWAIHWKVRRLRPRLDEKEARDATLEIVRRLLATDSIVAGFPTREGRFVGWIERGEEAIERIEREWMELNRAPGIGEIVWLVRRDVVVVEPSR